MSPRRRPRRGLEGLSSRQLEVLRLVASDVSRKEIAHRLGVNPRTIELHLAAARRGLGVLSTEAACHRLGQEDDAA